MNDRAKKNLRNVMALALADGRVTAEEKRLIETLGSRLELDAAEMSQLAAEVGADPSRLSVPGDPAERTELVRLLVQAATVDGEVAPQERRILELLADHVGMAPAEMHVMLGAAVRVPESARGPAEAPVAPQAAAPISPADEAEIERRIEELYERFDGWDDDRRRQAFAELGSYGRGAAAALLRVLESYRGPTGAADVLALKTLVAELLGRIGAPEAVYFLAHVVNMGDLDDEVSSSELRFASAEAIGRIVGRDFARDQGGLDAARLWWDAEGADRYDPLAR